MNSFVPKSGGNLVFLKTAVLMEKEYSETVATETLSLSPSYYLISKFLSPTAKASFMSYNLDFPSGLASSGGFSVSSTVFSYIF
jgi:hypothetical protein